MANFKLLILASSMVASGAAFATYQTPTPPANWLANTIKISPSDLSYANGIKSKIGLSVNLGSKAVTLSLAYRFAANASRVAAAAAYGAPLLFGVLAVGSAGYEAYKWFVDEGIEVKDGVWKKKVQYEVDGILYSWDGINKFTTPNEAGQHYVSTRPVSSAYTHSFISCTGTVGILCTYSKNPIPGQGGYYHTVSFDVYKYPGNVPATRYDQLTRQQFEDEMADEPIAPGMPQNFPIPEFPWPVELPVINPVEVPSPDRNLVQAFKPERVPMGEPVKVPQSSPPTVSQPVVDITPANKVTDPFLVDVVPKNVISPDLDADGKPDTVAPGEPDPSEEATSEEDLCLKNPEILACQKLDTPESDELETVDKDIAIEPQAGWGTGGASCPASRYLPGAQVEFSFGPMCDALGSFRPIILAVAWLSAAFILLGMKGGD